MWGACFISDEDRVHYPHYTTILFCSFISWTYFTTQTYWGSLDRKRCCVDESSFLMFWYLCYSFLLNCTHILTYITWNVQSCNHALREQPQRKIKRHGLFTSVMPMTVQRACRPTPLPFSPSRVIPPVSIPRYKAPTLAPDYRQRRDCQKFRSPAQYHVATRQHLSQGQVVGRAVRPLWR